VELYEATRKVGQILDEERVQPTVRYAWLLPRKLGSGWQTLAQMASPQALAQQRQFRPRVVHEDTQPFQFMSVNYDLLSALAGQVADRHSIVPAILGRIADPRAFRYEKYPKFPTWGSVVSELPLVLEFLVRTGNKPALFDALVRCTLRPGVLLLLMQLEEMIALNFNVFSEEELEQLPRCLNSIKEQCARLATTHGAPLNVPGTQDTYTHFAEMTGRVCKGIEETCRKARYFHLKGALLEGINLETNQDKQAVESSLQKWGFPRALGESLNHAEQLYRSVSPFELKSSMSHLRSFIEALHEGCAARLATKRGGSAPKRWGDCISFLQGNDLLSKPEENFVTALYTLISDEAVHPLVAEREYARLARNMVIEWGLLMLRKLEKSGL